MAEWSSFLNSISSSTFDNVLRKFRVGGIGLDGIDGFTFTVAKEHEVTLSSSITDYPIEDGTFAQNVIAINPERVRLSGLVGEVVYGKEMFMNVINTLVPSLVPISTLSPEICSATAQILNTLTPYLGEIALVSNQLKTIANRAGTIAQALGLTTDIPVNDNFTMNDISRAASMTIQEKAYYYLEACWKSRKLLTIETPWKYFDNMVIEELKFTQSEQSTTVSDVEVVFKRVISPKVREGEIDALRLGRNQEGTDNAMTKTSTAGIKQASNNTTNMPTNTSSVMVDEDGELYVVAYVDALGIRGDVD